MKVVSLSCSLYSKRGGIQGIMLPVVKGIYY